MKYMGSKSRIKKEIVPIINDLIKEKNSDTFIDLFCGGCNIIDSVNCENKYANDNSRPLIELLNAVIHDGKDLPNTITKDLYSDVRKFKDSDKYEQWFVGAVGFLASYNGRYFDGGYAKPNTSKDGKVRDYYQEAKRNLLKQKEQLLDVTFSNLDYLDFKIPENSVIYCDIPYKGTKQYNTSKGFDYDVFWNWVVETSKSSLVLVSEETAPVGFKVIWEQNVLRTVNNRGRQIALEKLYIYE